MSMTIQQAIRVLHLPGDHLRNYDEYGIYIDDELKEAMQMAKAALREKVEREDPQPLTIEELRQMDGEPVYLEYQLGQYTYTGWNAIKSVYLTEEGDCLKCIDGKLFSIVGMERVKFITGQSFATREYGKTWTTYRHKPKEASK